MGERGERRLSSSSSVVCTSTFRISIYADHGCYSLRPRSTVHLQTHLRLAGIGKTTELPAQYVSLYVFVALFSSAPQTRFGPDSSKGGPPSDSDQPRIWLTREESEAVERQKAAEIASKQYALPRESSTSRREVMDVDEPRHFDHPPPRLEHRSATPPRPAEADHRYDRRPSLEGRLSAQYDRQAVDDRGREVYHEDSGRRSYEADRNGQSESSQQSSNLSADHLHITQTTFLCRLLSRCILTVHGSFIRKLQS